MQNYRFCKYLIELDNSASYNYFSEIITFTVPSVCQVTSRNIGQYKNISC